LNPVYMNILGRVRYRLPDITDFEEDSLRTARAYVSARISTQQSVVMRSDPQDVGADIRRARQ
jgi:hypothetical protein